MHALRATAFFLLGVAAAAGQAQTGDSGTELTSQADIEALCRDYAEQDRVPAAELDAYLRDCVSSAEEAEAPGDEDAAPAGTR